jgi:DNA-binding transcriptional LysR family regulator
MDWDDLRYVLAIERAGTLTGAAAALGVTRTTVGRRLQATEQRLGVRLFDRTPDRLVPTGAGAELAHTAAHLEGEVLTVEGRVLGRDAELHGGLRVSTLDFVFQGFIDVFASFMRRYPGILLTVQATNVPVSLQRREADVALRLSNHPPEHLVGRKVGRLEFEAYGERSLVASLGPAPALSDYPWLHWDERSDVAWLDTWLAHNAPGARVACRFGDYASMRHALAAGIGVHFLPCFDGDADPSLVRIGARLEQSGQDLWVLTLPDNRHNRRIRAFMDHAYEAFAVHREAMAGVITPRPG